MNQYVEKNKKLWEELTSIHTNSSHYQIDEFKEGNTSLRPIELKELGDVSGKSMLHLQCHFGLDSLSWSRLGAKVTGIDFDETAINYAKVLSKELNIPANFICSDMYDLPNMLTEQFDIVYTSYGVLTWLPDLTQWAAIIEKFLKPSGTFCIVEGHPICRVFGNEPEDQNLQVKYSYFHQEAPTGWPPSEDYADRSAKVSHTSYEWTHSFSDIINSLIKAGLTITSLKEYPYGVYDHFPFMEQSDDGWWRLKGDEAKTIPMTFSLKATK